MYGDAQKQTRALNAVGRAPAVRIVGGNIMRSDDHLAGKRPRPEEEPEVEVDDDEQIQEVLRRSVLER